MQCLNKLLHYEALRSVKRYWVLLLKILCGILLFLSHKSVKNISTTEKTGTSAFRLLIEKQDLWLWEISEFEIQI